MKKHLFIIIIIIFSLKFSAKSQITCDDFNVPNTTTISGWTEQSGDWQILNNMLRTPGNILWEYITFNGSSRTDGCITARAIYDTPSQVKFVGVVGRYSSTTSNIMFKIQDNTNTGTWNKCFFVVDGSSVFSFDGNFGTDAIIQMQFSGANVTVRIDVERDGIWDYTNSTTTTQISSGLCGVGAYNTAYIDDFCYGSNCCDLPADAGIISGSSEICVGENNVPYNVPTITGSDSCIWNYSGTGVSINGNTESITIDFSAFATSGDLSVYGQNTCGVGITSQVFPIIVNQLPDAAGSISGDLVVCNETVSNPYSVATIPEATLYQWNYSGTGATINGSGNSITIDFGSAATSGTLSVYGENDCGTASPSTIDITVNDCTDIDEHQNLSVISIVPNPSQGLFKIDYSGTENTEYDLMITNTFGQKVFELSGLNSRDLNNMEIDLSHLPSGIYNIIIDDHLNYYRIKVLIAK